MIYITEFVEILLQFSTDWGERLNGGPKAEMLAHTLKYHTEVESYILRRVIFSIPVPKLNMTLYAFITHIT